jgi:hypothetical protein
MLMQLLTGAGIGLAGCTGIQGSEGTDTATPGDSDMSNPQEQQIFVVISNETAEPITLSIELSTEETVLLEEEMTIKPGRLTSYFTGIHDEGKYELSVVLDDRENKNTFDIEEYELETGSNILVWLEEDVIRFGKEN